MDNKIVLTGVLQNFDYKSNSRVYSKELYDKYLIELEDRIKQEERYKKIKKLKDNVNGRQSIS